MKRKRRQTRGKTGTRMTQARRKQVGAHHDTPKPARRSPGWYARLISYLYQ